MKRIIPIGLIYIIAVLPVTAQNSSPFFLDASLHYGFIIIHSDELRSVKDSYPYGIDVGFGKQFISQNAYDACKCSPKLGFNLQLWDYDSPEVLGRGTFFNFLIETQFLNGNNKVFPSATFGTGLVYGSKPYDAETNPNNLSYSTKVSFSLLASGSVHYKIRNSINAFLRVNYNHSSNGGRKEPNKGINFPTVSLGASFYPNPPENLPNFSSNEKKVPERTSKIELRSFASSKNVSAVGDAEYFIGGIEGLYSRWIGGVHTMTASTEWVWDYARKKRMELNGEGDEKFVRAAALVGHEFELGSVVFRQAVGVYFIDDFKVNDAWYQRYSLHFKVSGPVYASIGVKAHRHVADFLDLGLSFRY